MTEEKDRQTKHHDLTEQASNRVGDEQATGESRKAASDDSNERVRINNIDTPRGDSWGESKVATSLDED